jgi:penicillin-binding protein 1A
MPRPLAQQLLEAVCVRDDDSPCGQFLLRSEAWAATASFPWSVGALLAEKARAAARRVETGLEDLWRKRAVRLVTPPLLAVGVALAALVQHTHFDRANLPELSSFIGFELPTTGEVYDSQGERLLQLALEYRRIVPYREIPGTVRDAVLAAEDKAFFSHHGIDWTSLPRVLAKAASHTALASWRASSEARRVRIVPCFPQGGSTITQQLVRGYFLGDMTSRERGGQLLARHVPMRLLGTWLGIPTANKLARKLEEIRLSLWLEEAMAAHYGSRARAKQEIFARYASFVYLGNGRYGLAAGSEYYFGQPLASLTPADAHKAAVLAGITKSPRLYAPSANNQARVLKRRNETLRLMTRNGFLGKAQSDHSQQAPLSTVDHAAEKTLAPAVIDTVFAELQSANDARLSAGQLALGRIRVHSTVHGEIQRIANRALEQGLAAYEKRHPGSEGLVQGSVVVLGNADARILAETGGRQVFKARPRSYTDLNRVTDTRRQPGSVMKPIVYLAAFQEGVTLDTLVPDSPLLLSMGFGRPAKSVRNYDGEFKGPIAVRQALAESRNAATVWVARAVGMPRVLRMARAVGIRTPLQPYVSTALGASEVQLLELANAYRSIASGVLAEPFVVDFVATSAGEVIFRRQPQVEPLRIEPDVLRQVQEGLRGVVRLPGGTARSLSSLPLAVMGKTGTTNAYRDALFVGSTFGRAGITVAVRIGYDDNRVLGPGETGGRTALPVFREIVARVYEAKLVPPAARFPGELEDSISQYLAIASDPRQPPPDAVMLTHQPGPAPATVAHASGDR